MNWKKTLLICLVILVSAGAITVVIFLTEPTAQREGATKETAMLVDIETVEMGDYRPIIAVAGTVEASQDIILGPRVSGEVTSLAPGFTPGGTVRKGTLLLQIDPSDYRHVLEMRKTELAKVESDLALEMGRQDVAKKDYQLFDDTLARGNEALVLREPQLKATKAAVEAARVAVSQADLNLSRTTIRAPFDAHIISRNVNIGSQVAPGETLGRLVGLDTYWVIVTVPVSKLPWLRFPEEGRYKGSKVKIRNRTAWKPGVFRTGYLLKLIGALDDQTRMARALVVVDDPLANRGENQGLPPLIIGSFVEVRIEGEAIPDVVRLSRDYLRNDSTVWVMQDSLLFIRDVEIVFTDAEFTYIKNGLMDGDSVVTTNLTTVVDSARLRLEQSDTTAIGESSKDTTDIGRQGSQYQGGVQ